MKKKTVSGRKAGMLLKDIDLITYVAKSPSRDFGGVEVTSQSGYVDFWLLASDFCFENSRPYERTQHVIENKAHDFSEPSISLKINSLTEETQHIFDNKIPSLEFRGVKNGNSVQIRMA